MIIRKATINGFGKYSDKEFIFQEGLNCIFGENEAGKTTLLWFIRGMLYGLKGGRAKVTGEQSPLRRFQPWSKGPYSGSMEIKTDEGALYYISRDFESKKLSIRNDRYVDVTNDLLTSADMQPGEVFLGMNESCFESTCFIGSSGAFLSVNDRKDIESKLTDVSETGFFDVSLANALSLLEDLRKKEIGITTDRRAGRDKPLPKALQRIQELEEELSRYEKIREKILSLQDSLEDIQKQIKNQEEKISLLALEEEVLDCSKSVFGEIVKIGSLKKVADLLEDNKKSLDRIQLSEKELREKLEHLSVFADETAETVKIPEKSFDRERLYRMDYEKASKALKQYEEEKNRLVEQIREYEAFLNHQKDIDLVFDLARILPAYDQDAIQSVAIKKEEQQKELQAVIHTCKRNDRWLALMMVIMIGSFGITAWNLLGLIPAGVMLIVSLVLFVRRKRLHNRRIHMEESISWDVVTPETIRFSDAAQKLKDTLRLFSCPTFDHFKRRLDEYKSLINKIDSITHGLKRQSREKDEKFKLWADERAQLDRAIAKFKKDGDKDYESVLKEIDSGWNEYVHTKMLLDQCLNRQSELLLTRSGLFAGIREEGYSDDEQLNKAIPSRLENVKQRIFLIKEKAKGVTNPELLNAVTCLIKMDTASTDSLLEELSSKNKQERDKAIPAHGRLKIDETRILRDLEGLWAEYDGLKNAEEELLMQKETRDQLVSQDKIINETMEQLERAGDEVKTNFYQPMTERLNRYMQFITSGRHNDMRVSEELQVNASIENGIRNVMDFSTGTTEQIFFALRLVCIEMMEGEKKCPVFADEIFAAFDDRRATNTLRLLADFGALRQIFLFTCRMREPNMAKEVLPDVHIIHI